MFDTPIEIFKYLNIISIILMAIIIAIICRLICKKEGFLLATISQTISKNEKIHLVYSIAMSILVPIYYSSLLLYLGPKHAMPVIFDITLIIALIFELIFLWLPSRGKTAIVHRNCAIVTTSFMLLNILLVPIFGTNVGSISKTIIILFIIGISFFSIYWLFDEKVRKKSFLVETICLILYFVIVMLLLYFNI